MPIRTSFGWHIIQRIDRKEIPSYEDAKSEIERKVGKDQRADVARRALINKLKKEYNFNEYIVNVPVRYDTVQNVYIIKQKYLEKNALLGDTLFTFFDRVFLEKDFDNYVNAKTKKESTSSYQYKLFYDEFIDDKILEIEESMLEEKYPEYKYLLKEYHDGMLLFEITDQKIWSKAINDSIGLRAFYDDHKRDYMWDERWEGSLYFCSNKQVYDKVKKIIGKGSFGKNVTNENLLEQINKESDLLKIETGLFNKGDNDFVDHLIWNQDKEDTNTDLVLYKGKKISSKIKTFDEARGVIISDYQDYLEKEWINKLKSKYNIQVNNSVLSAIKNHN